VRGYSTRVPACEQTSEIGASRLAVESLASTRETFNFPPTPDPAAINVPGVLFACDNKCFDTDVSIVHIPRHATSLLRTYASLRVVAACPYRFVKSYQRLIAFLSCSTRKIRLFPLSFCTSRLPSRRVAMHVNRRDVVRAARNALHSFNCVIDRTNQRNELPTFA